MQAYIYLQMAPKRAKPPVDPGTISRTDHCDLRSAPPNFSRSAKSTQQEWHDPRGIRVSLVAVREGVLHARQHPKSARARPPMARITRSPWAGGVKRSASPW